MSFIIGLLTSVFPFLFGALERTWNNLTTPQQSAIVNSGLIGQYLKNNLTALSGDLVVAISTHTGLSTDEVSTTLIGLAKTFGLTTTSIDEAVAFLQKKLSSAASDAEWNGILSILLNAGGTLLSGGTLNWVHLALGIGEWAYHKFVAPSNLISVTTVTPATTIVQDFKSVSVATDNAISGWAKDKTAVASGIDSALNKAGVETVPPTPTVDGITENVGTVDASA